MPGSLAEALDALEADHAFLIEGGVFSEELIRTWIDYKRENEVDVVRLRPHPAEFSLYFDADRDGRRTAGRRTHRGRLARGGAIYAEGIATRQRDLRDRCPFVG